MKRKTGRSNKLLPVVYFFLLRHIPEANAAAATAAVHTAAAVPPINFAFSTLNNKNTTTAHTMQRRQPARESAVE